LCDIETTDTNGLATHMAGKKHKKKVSSSTVATTEAKAATAAPVFCAEVQGLAETL
jgi:hypothetical protein